MKLLPLLIIVALYGCAVPTKQVFPKPPETLMQPPSKLHTIL